MRAAIIISVCLALCSGFVQDDVKRSRKKADVKSQQDEKPSAKKTNLRVQKNRQSAVQKRANQQKVTDVDQDKLFNFVKEHHSDLIRLLNWLKENRPKKHVEAMRSLTKQYLFLERKRETSPIRYQYNLKKWKLESRIQLWAIKLTFEDSPEHRAKLKKMISDLKKLEIDQLKIDVERVAGRLQRLKVNLNNAKKTKNASVDKMMKDYINKARVSKARINKGKKKQSGKK